MELKALLSKPLVLPSIPKVLALLLSELGRETPDLRKITQFVGTDPALTTSLLRIANSDFFKLTGRIHSVSEALALLSCSQVRSVVAAAASGASLRAVPGIHLQQFWRYSLQVAKLARSLAGLVRQNQPAAYTCGLIHAVGELAIHIGMPQEVALLDRDIGPFDLGRADAERQTLGFCYAQVGAGLARLWQYPQPMVDALEHQYAPFEHEVYEPLAGVIHLATWRVRSQEAGLPERGLAVTFPGAVGEVLGLDIDMVLQQNPFDWMVQSSGHIPL
jgi:HD-like signal output (HDOD) protein